jgi:hypothetical protein
MQEIATLILAYAVLVDYRIEAATVGAVGVLRISFMKTPASGARVVAVL